MLLLPFPFQISFHKKSTCILAKLDSNLAILPRFQTTYFDIEQILTRSTIIEHELKQK